MWFKEHFLSLTIIPLIVLLAASAYYRFNVQLDYLVSYEGDCDPTTSSCYVGCLDDECTDEYYYLIMERRAYEVNALCGPDVSICDAAYECQPDIEECSIYFCDTEEDGEDACYSETSAHDTV